MYKIILEGLYIQTDQCQTFPQPETFWILFLTQSHLYLLFLERGYLAGEPLGVFGSPVVGELLLHVSHDLVFKPQTQGTLFLQLPPLIVHFSLVGGGFLQSLRKGIGKWNGCRGKEKVQRYWDCAQLFLSSGYLREPGEGALCLLQRAEAGTIVGLHSLLLGLLLTDQFVGGSTVHLGPVQLHS